MLDLKFCDLYSYPSGIRDYLYRVFIQLELASIHSILLVGSTSRGEITYRHEMDGLDLFSDLEFFIVPKPGKRIDRERLRKECADLETEAPSHNMLFHIEARVIEISKPRKLPPTISTYEAKENGKIVFGDNIIPLLPTVTLGNLDLGNTNHLVLVRLTEMLLHIPKRIILGNPSEYELFVFKYVLVRNALDIPTILLPHEGVLLPTYRQRVDFVQENYSKLKSNRFFGNDFPALLQECLVGKLEARFISSAEDLYQRGLNSYLGLLNFLVGSSAQVSTQDWCSGFLDSSLKLTERIFITKQKLFELSLVYEQARNKGIKSGVKLAFRRRKLMICFLLNMHLALLSHLGGKSEAKAYLREARKYLSAARIVSFRQRSRQDFADEWLYLRRKYVDLITRFYLSKRKNIAYYRKVLDWSH